MGLTSGTSLSSGSGGSGITLAQVDSRIAAKQPWTFIDKVDVTTPVAQIELDLSTGYTTYMVQGDKIGGSTSSYIYARYIYNGTQVQSGYGVNQYRARSTSGGYQYQEATSEISFNPTDITDHSKTFELVFTTGGDSRRPVFRFHLGSGNSTYDPVFSIGGGQLNISPATEFTQIMFRMNTGNITGGSFKLYGLNNHD